MSTAITTFLFEAGFVYFTVDIYSNMMHTFFRVIKFGLWPQNNMIIAIINPATTYQVNQYTTETDAITHVEKLRAFHGNTIQAVKLIEFNTDTLEIVSMRNV